MSHSICNSHATVKSVVVSLAISANLKYQRHYRADCSLRTQIRGGWTLQVGEGFFVYLCKEGGKVLQGLINMQIFKEAWHCPSPPVSWACLKQRMDRAEQVLPLYLEDPLTFFWGLRDKPGTLIFFTTGLFLSQYPQNKMNPISQKRPTIKNHCYISWAPWVLALYYLLLYNGTWHLVGA